MARLLLLALVVALAACAQRPVTFDKAASRDIHSIAVLSCSEPAEYQSINAYSAARYFGLLGALTENATSQANGKQLTEALADQHPRICPALTSRLTTDLRQEGYKVTVLQVARAQPTETLDNYAGIKADDDAILDVAVNDAGVSAGRDGLYHPYIMVKAKLVKMPDQQTLYSDFAIYSLDSGKLVISRGLGIATKVAESDAPRDIAPFPNADAVRDHPEQVAAALRAGIDPLADYVAQQMQQ